MPAISEPLRFGLVGTGHWAQIVHAPALASTDGIELAAVWGRNPDAARALADSHRATAFADLDEFLAGVDAVCFAVPPDVQSAIAVRAANAGKHLLLEKPIAATAAAAEDLVGAVERAGVASVVFFTFRFEPEVRAWLTEVTNRGGWSGGASAWFGTALLQSSPFNTPWRHVKGGLWDLAPHVLSLLWPTLGPVTAVTADAGEADITHLVLHHARGATSTATVTLSAPDAADGFELYLWGESGRSNAPDPDHSRVAALRIALTELAANVRSGQVRHECDVRFGRDVVRVLAEAQRQLDDRRSRSGAAPPGLAQLH